MLRARNVRRQDFGIELRPVPPHFCDHLTVNEHRPALCELLKLQWSSIDFDRRWLTVEGRNAKTRQTRHVPLNDEAIGLLARWREQTDGLERIFAVTTSFKTVWAKLLRRAQITRFRWHDLRHHFATGTARGATEYRPGSVGSHLGGNVAALRALAPDQRREAVLRINSRPILAATLVI